MISIKSLDNIGQAAKEFVAQMGNHSLFAFYGDMGAGKTTFIKAICQELEVADPITSPTFAIVNEYWAEKIKKKIYHFDFYRVEKIEEVYDFGYEDYLYSDAICFIEWPERIESVLPEDCVSVNIIVNNDNSRNIISLSLGLK